jgi:hypothetical protein
MFRLRAIKPIQKHIHKAASKALKRLQQASPAVHPVKVVLVPAYVMPHGKGFSQGFFWNADPDTRFQTIYAAALYEGDESQQVAELQDTLAHEWGHMEQARDGFAIAEGRDIARRTKRLLKAVRGK